MTTRYDVVVVGGGVGGLVAAIRLANAGRSVAVFERNKMFGGKLAVYERDGFSFDIGPSLLTLPTLLDEVFRLAGTSLEKEVDVVRLDPSFRYFWPDASTVTFHDEQLATAEALDAFAPGSGVEYLDYLKRARAIWRTSQRTFFAGDLGSPVSLIRRMRSPRDFATIDARRSLLSRAESSFADPRLRQWLGRYATYSGSDPARAPATLGCIAAVEADYGAWYVRGGLGAVRDALVRVAQNSGVVLHKESEVSQITATRRRVTGVRIGDTTVLADVVISNADAVHLYRDLLPHDRRLRDVQRTERSTSGIAVLVGVEGRTPHIAHHNVWFSRDYEREFRDIQSGKIPRDPTIYGCVSSISDPTQAPPGCENWFLLINVPADGREVTDEVGEWLLNRLASFGPDLRSRARFIEVIGPAHIARWYRSPGGAIYGTSSNGRSAAFRRPAMRGPRRGLYLVGGSTHPGGGLPLVTMGARIVSDLILRREARR